MKNCPNRKVKSSKSRRTNYCSKWNGDHWNISPHGTHQKWPHCKYNLNFLIRQKIVETISKLRLSVLYGNRMTADSSSKTGSIRTHFAFEFEVETCCHDCFDPKCWHVKSVKIDCRLTGDKSIQCECLL